MEKICKRKNSDFDAHELYESLDYRDFLRTRLLRQKRFSLETVARRSGCVSKSYLSLIIAKKRSLRDDKALLIGRAIGLKGSELRYFDALVRFSRSRSSAGKEHLLKELAAIRPRRQVDSVGFDDMSLLRNWHAMVVRELFNLRRPPSGATEVVSRLRGLMTVSEASRALDLLVRTGLLIDRAGQLRPNHVALRSQDEIKTLAIQSYHRSSIELGLTMLEKLGVSEREFGSVNLSISEDGFAKIKQKLKSVRDEILEIAVLDTAPSLVAQFNFQFFQVSQPLIEKEIK